MRKRKRLHAAQTRAALRNPPRSVGDYLAALERLGLSRAVSLLRRRETAI